MTGRARTGDRRGGYHPLVTARRFEICIDATDPDRLRPFWRAALGYVDKVTAEGAVDLVDPAGVRPTVWFQVVPEPKVAKNRLHLDIEVPSAYFDRLRDELRWLGGTVVTVHPRFTVLSDPEGNELCLNAG
jgi:4a-hydroxytetrahydrobiopterin dehydratase